MTQTCVLCTTHLGYTERDSYAAFYTVAIDQLIACTAWTPRNVAYPKAIGKR